MQRRTLVGIARVHMQYAAVYAVDSTKHTTAALLTVCGKQDHLYVRYVGISSMGKSV